MQQKQVVHPAYIISSLSITLDDRLIFHREFPYIFQSRKSIKTNWYPLTVPEAFNYFTPNLHP